jgi:hypothetical protein
MIPIKFILTFGIFFCLHFTNVYSQSDNQFDAEVELSQLLNGQYVKSLEKIKWTPYTKENVQTSEDGFAYTTVDSVITYKTNNEEYRLVVFRTNIMHEGMEEQCAGCAPTLGLALFKIIEGKPTLTSLNRSVLNVGQAGMLPDYSIVELSAESKGLLVKEGNFQDSDVYCFLYSLDEANVSNLVFEFPHFRMLNYDKGKHQTSTLTILNNDQEANYILQLETNTFVSEKKLSSKKVNYIFNGRRWEPIESK